MRIKTFRARTASEALTQVKAEFGADAVILHTRTARVRGVLGLPGKAYTEITASDGPAEPRHPRPTRGVAKPATTSPALTYRPTPVAAPEPSAVLPSRAEVAAAPPAQDEERALARHIIASAAPKPELHAASAPTPEWHGELDSIKKMMGQVLRSTRGVREPSMPDALFEYYRKLIEADVSDELADRVAGAVRDDLTRLELQNNEMVRRAVLRQLARYIPVSGSLSAPERSPEGRPQTIALVGPTGVGKTTTLAKLAATYRLRHGKRVGLITSDTYRIAAVDQLRTYATIIGVPFKVAMTPSEMRSACESLADCDVILVDTAGRSPRDKGRISELKDILGAARPHTTHLVLSSTSSGSVMHAAAESFAALRPDHVIFTKLDEAVSLGVVLDVTTKLNTSLSFVTTGQEVPDDIEAGDASRLAELVLDRGAA